MKPVFFRKQADLRKWLEKNHDKKDELLAGFYKKSSGKPSITWEESVDEALCFGWIDGIRKSLNEISYTIRFTPRRNSSKWSTKNINRVEELIKLEQMRPAGVRAYSNRKEENSDTYSFEQRIVKLDSEYQNIFKKNKKAWEDFNSRAPSYRKPVTHWVMSAKQEATRLRRLEILISCCEKGEVIPLMRWAKSKKSK